MLRDLERVLPELPIIDMVWREAYALAQKARGQAITVPSADILIAACARHHAVALETADSDFTLLAKLR